MSIPLVSIIVPTFNRAVMVTQAIDSALGQSLADREVIVVDDGSTDGTEEGLRRYGSAIRFVQTENGGVAHARNVGMRHARGRYLTFLDSDDLLYPYALELQARLLDRFPEAGFVCAEMSGFDDAGFFEKYHLQRYHHSAYRNPSVTYDRMFGTRHTLSDVVAVPEGLRDADPSAPGRSVYLGNVFDTYLSNLVLCQNSVMLRRDVAEEAGDRNVEVRHWQEVDYLLRITRKHSICFVDVPTYRLRYHAGQISGTMGQDGPYRWIRKQQILLRVVKRHATVDPDYYASHRGEIDRHLSHLSRAVAVPMLVFEGPRPLVQRYGRYARLYLRQCARYGYPARGLLIAALAPAPLRRVLIRTAESMGQLSRRLRTGVATMRTRLTVARLAEKAYV